jgi:CPA1 family monovalent cation:H+ antiporter
MELFQAIFALIALAALGAYANHRFLGFPPTIGLMAISLVLSIGVFVGGRAGLIDTAAVRSTLETFDFSNLLLHGMLAYLLFAGALHVDFQQLRSEALSVALLTTVGLAVTTAIAGTLFWLSAQALHFDMPYRYALLFGALIAPTDPIAVLGVLKQVRSPQALQIQLSGESLFNDGVGVVLFVTVLGTVDNGAGVTWSGTLAFLAIEALGGIAVGGAVGWAVYRLIMTVDEYALEVLLTLGLAGGVYALAEGVHVSAPISVVVAGLIIGNRGRAFAMSERTREHIDSFWELQDEILNAVLFVLIGLEVLVLEFDSPRLLAVLGALCILSVLSARLIGVTVPWLVLALAKRPCGGDPLLLTWAGLRGGISIALALSLPASSQREIVVACTYAVVVFSILVQGLTLGRLVRKRT